MKHITLKDIAKELNVSVSTVSRAMNDVFDINKETRAHILQKAKEMGYRPNPIARNLHNRKTRQIGVVVPELYNDFFPRFSKGCKVFCKKKVINCSSCSRMKIRKPN